MKTPAHLIVLITLIGSRTKVFCFNIEDRNPIVKRASEKGSYFGFSVAQHVAEENSRRQSDYWILVGAPLGQNLQPRTNRSGALYKCPITNDQTDCIQIETDGKRLESFDYDDNAELTLKAPPPLAPPGPDEIKEDQWLGVSVKSQKPGGKVVVCAHRYIQSPNINSEHHGLGLCYLLNKHLETEEDLQPCKGRPTERLHQQFAFCQVGTSLAVLEDGFALMGSPGPYTWRGTVFAENVVGEFLDKDKTVYKGPLNDNPSPIDKYSYLGMSVAGGHFFSRDTLNFAAGAPRSQLSGQVYFFNKTKYESELSIPLIIDGEQFASSFGYEILATDIDRDGYDELLVAAPFYYGPDQGGAVYVYRNLRSCTNVSCNHSAILTGKVESRFGFAMASLGDINKDGFTDVAIGAPYEDDTGAVYIYLGSKDGLKKDFSQKIQHKESGIRTLGYSLSAGLDMDRNQYPDLLVGAYESDMVILYKTRPIVDITINIKGEELKNINVTKRGCSEDRYTNKTCFTFMSCFTISQVTHPISVRLEMKELPKRIPRVVFKNYQKRSIGVKNRNEHCTRETVYLAEGTGDILSPIKFQVQYSLADNLIDSPMLNETSVKEFEATFLKNCGEDNICNSNLTLDSSLVLEDTDGEYILDLGTKKELLIDVNVANWGEPAYEATLYVNHPNALSYIALVPRENKTSSDIICTSNEESTWVTCNLGNPVQANKIIDLRMRFEVNKDTRDKQLKLEVFVNSTSNELSKQTSKSFNVVLRKIAHYLIKGKLLTQSVFYSGKVKGQSAMRYFEDVGPKVYHSYDVINRGHWALQGVQVIIHWPYQVYTDRKEGGKWLLYLEREPLIENNPINSCKVVPYEVVNRLSLSRRDNSDAPENLIEDTNFEHVRRRRDVEQVVAPETKRGQDGKQRRVVTMDCRKKTAKCAEIACTIPVLEENSQVNIRVFSRIWNSTLMEDYNNVDWVSIKSTAEIRFAGTARVIESSEDSTNETTVELIAYPAQVLADSGLNIWIIIGSVLAGLVLLIILIVILYKFGFFKRNRIKDHTLSGSLKKQDENETLLKETESKAKPTKSPM